MRSIPLHLLSPLALIIFASPFSRAQVGPTDTLQAVHAASIGSSVTPGSLLALRPIGPSGAIPVTGKLFLDIHGMEITLTSAASGQKFTPAPIARMVPGEVWVAVPLNMPLGSASATMTVNGTAIGTASFQVVDLAPGLFVRMVNGYTWSTASGSGNYGSTSAGPALAQNLPVTSDASMNGLANPAVPGQFVTLWGTGLHTSLAPGQTSSFIVDVAGIAVVPTFAGPQAGGLDQINFKIPANAPVGCYVPVTLRKGDVASNTVTLSINTNPGACPHPLGLSYSDLLALDAGNSVMVGEVNVSSSEYPTLDGGRLGFTYPLSTSKVESFGVDISPRDANAVFQVAGVQIPYNQYFACQSSAPGVTGAIRGFSGPSNATSPTVLTGPNGKRLESISQLGFGSVYQQIPDAMLPFFSAGSWTLTMPQAGNVSAFQHSFTLPPPVRITNRDELAMLRTGDDITVKWDPQGYGVSDIATLQLVNSTSLIVSPNMLTSLKILTCHAYAFQGQFTLPKIDLLGGGILTMTVSPEPAARQRFAVPLTTGGVAQTVVDYLYGQPAFVAFH